MFFFVRFSPPPLLVLIVPLWNIVQLLYLFWFASCFASLRFLVWFFFALFGNDEERNSVNAHVPLVEARPALAGGIHRGRTRLDGSRRAGRLLLLLDPQTTHLVSQCLVGVVVFVGIAVQARKAVLPVEGIVVVVVVVADGQRSKGNVAAKGAARHRCGGHGNIVFLVAVAVVVAVASAASVSVVSRSSGGGGKLSLKGRTKGRGKGGIVGGIGDLGSDRSRGMAGCR